MLKKTITFHDLDGNSITDDFYFNLNKAEVIELNLSHPGGLEGYFNEISSARDGGKIIKLFKELILMSYGKRAADGIHFEKSDELREKFSQTDAYSELFTELCTDSGAAAAFFNGIVPKNNGIPAPVNS